jgi:hypothetical protein
MHFEVRTGAGLALALRIPPAKYEFLQCFVGQSCVSHHLKTMGSSDVPQNQPRYATLDPGLSIEETREARTFLKQLSVEVASIKKSAPEGTLLIVSSECRQKALDVAAEYPERRVIGIECLRHCIKYNVALPHRNAPVLTCKLRGTIICFSGFNAKQKQDLSNLADCMGATVSPGLSLSVTHLVAETLDSDKCRFIVTNAQAGTSRVRIVETRWLEECWSSRQQEPLHELPYLLPMPIFSNKRMSCTGFTIDERKEMSGLAKRFGATFVQDLDSKCTHLIAQSNSGNKYWFAVKRGIPVVSAQWLSECCFRFKCLSDVDAENNSSQSAFLVSGTSTPGALIETPRNCSQETDQAATGRVSISRQSHDECSFFEGLKFYFPSDLPPADCRELTILCR